MEDQITSNIERLLGRLEQFMNTSEKEFERNVSDHAEIKKTLDDLKAFKVKVIAYSAVFSLLISSFAHPIIELLFYKNK
jgi:hypothetical protein